MPPLRSTTRRRLPLGPLLHAYRAAGLPSIADLHRLPGCGERFAALLAASARFLYPDFLDQAKDDALAEALVRFYEAVVPLPLHAATVRRRVGFLRHALAHLMHGRDPAARKLAACVAATGTYRVPGLGPAFWSALLQGLSPARHPGWTTATRTGLDRLDDAAGGAEQVYAQLMATHARIREAQPDWTPLHVDHFLSLVGTMPGRDLFAGAGDLARCPVREALQRLRARTPLRQRLKERGRAIADGQELLRAALVSQDSGKLQAALALADPAGRVAVTGDGLLEWVGRIWESEDPYFLLSAFWKDEPLPGAGLWLLPAVLHLRDPQRYLPFGDALRQGLAGIDDGFDRGDPPADRYRLANEAAAALRERFALHPLEVPDLLASLACKSDEPEVQHPQSRFRGFCGDTFAFLGELARENRRAWMDEQRDRYHFAVRGPLVELCRDLTARYVEPVIGGLHGIPLDTRARAGHALTSVCKNVFGKSVPYTSTLWVTFCRPGEGRRGAQLFVRVGPDGVRFGLRINKTGRADRHRLQSHLHQHGDSLHQLLRDAGAFETCAFGNDDAPNPLLDLPALQAWAHGRHVEASCRLAIDDPLLATEELVDHIVRVFDQLLPLFAACVCDDLTPLLARLGVPTTEPTFGGREFQRQTYQSDRWLRDTLDLLALKKQLILQGPPGTGKTHVARCLARLLTSGHDDAVRLVQFHPAYSYEEFVEGIRVRSVSVEGRHDVTYPVEDGLLCAFAARAASRPSQPHVLLIDEINRGNLPRIFGELLYLLEYRNCAVELPYSRRDFHLPDNLYVLATMNAADRSLALVDQALRRRFSFVVMEPDAHVLTSWLAAHPPPGGSSFAARVVSLFERLNARLGTEAGPHARIGHSYFMIDGLDEPRLRRVWQHHVRPVLDEVFAGQPGRAAAYDGLLEPGRSRPARPEAQPS